LINLKEYADYEFDGRENVDKTKSGMIIGGDEVREVESF